MNTFRCTFGADVFTRLVELVIEKDILKLDDGQYYAAHYACCTFNTRRQNSRKGLTRIQLAPCYKTNFPEDWISYWFYVKVDMSKIPGYNGISLSSLLTYRGGDCHLHCSLQLSGSWFQELRICILLGQHDSWWSRRH
jgi:hypothetical protein